MMANVSISELEPGKSYVIRARKSISVKEADRILATFALIAPEDCRFLVLDEGVGLEELTEHDLERLREAWG